MSPTDRRFDALVDDRRYRIYRNLAEWRDLNATRALREYRNGESFLFWNDVDIGAWISEREAGASGACLAALPAAPACNPPHDDGARRAAVP